jgi:hypothetical protein
LFFIRKSSADEITSAGWRKPISWRVAEVFVTTAESPQLSTSFSTMAEERKKRKRRKRIVNGEC